MSDSAESVALEMAKVIADKAAGLSHVHYEQKRFIALFLDCLAATKGDERALRKPAETSQPEAALLLTNEMAIPAHLTAGRPSVKGNRDFMRP